MNIDIPNALAMQDVAIDEPQDFVALGHRNGRQILEQFENRHAIVQTSASNLTNHKRMHDDVRAFQQVNKPRIATAKVIDPSIWAAYLPTGQDAWRFHVR